MRDDRLDESAGAGGIVERAGSRRDFLARVLMWGGLAAGYGLGLLHFFRYLVPIGRRQKYREMYVGTLDQLPIGASRVLQDPAGRSFVLSRTGPEGERILALSDTCPHLGCKVHWEAARGRFLCPCHMGMFTPEGEPVSGPPADMADRGRLERYAVRVRGPNIFVLVKEAADVFPT